MKDLFCVPVMYREKGVNTNSWLAFFACSCHWRFVTLFLVHCSLASVYSPFSSARINMKSAFFNKAALLSEWQHLCRSWTVSRRTCMVQNYCYMILWLQSLLCERAPKISSGLFIFKLGFLLLLFWWIIECIDCTSQSLGYLRNPITMFLALCEFLCWIIECMLRI